MHPNILWYGVVLSGRCADGRMLRRRTTNGSASVHHEVGTPIGSMTDLSFIIRVWLFLSANPFC